MGRAFTIVKKRTFERLGQLSDKNCSLKLQNVPQLSPIGLRLVFFERTNPDPTMTLGAVLACAKLSRLNNPRNRCRKAETNH
jgi:hypothetical protein